MEKPIKEMTDEELAYIRDGVALRTERGDIICLDCDEQEILTRKSVEGMGDLTCHRCGDKIEFEKIEIK